MTSIDNNSMLKHITITSDTFHFYCIEKIWGYRFIGRFVANSPYAISTMHICFLNTKHHHTSDMDTLSQRETSKCQSGYCHAFFLHALVYTFFNGHIHNHSNRQAYPLAHGLWNTVLLL